MSEESSAKKGSPWDDIDIDSSQHVAEQLGDRMKHVAAAAARHNEQMLKFLEKMKAQIADQERLFASQLEQTINELKKKMRFNLLGEIEIKSADDISIVKKE